jgi:hypothetical protein
MTKHKLYKTRKYKTSARLLPLESPENERKAAALGVPRKGVLGIKVLLRAGVCRPREKLARSITSLAPALTLTTPCLCSLFLTGFSTTSKQYGKLKVGVLMEKPQNAA